MDIEEEYFLNIWEKKPKRFFAFGCSFTEYNWATWANILAFELGPDVEFYNFGMVASGNRYIATAIAQADEYFNFNKDDLVMVCWTNITRFDYFDEKDGVWQIPGNITTQHYFPKEFVDNYTNTADFYLSSFTNIKLASEMLKKTNCHHLQMANFTKRPGVFRKDKQDRLESSIKSLYENTLSEIHPCFFETLWQDRNGRKYAYNRTLHPKFGDLHPTPKEHMTYLEKIFDTELSQETHDRVEDTERLLKVALDEVGEEVAPSKNHLGAGVFTVKRTTCYNYDLHIRIHDTIPECFIL